MSDDAEAAYQRWRQRALEQLGVYNNVLIGLASGAIVLGTSVVLDHWVEASRGVLRTLLSGFFLSALSLAIGIFVMMNRAEAFRIAARRARARARGEGDLSGDFSKERADKIDHTTRCGLRWQGASFLLSLALLCASLLVRYVWG